MFPSATYHLIDESRFRGKYRIESTRLKHYDYSSDGAYFITICAKNMEHFFGEIRDGEMRLSEMGKIVAHEWEQTEIIRNYIILDEWVVMPNHFHAIVIINKPITTPTRTTPYMYTTTTNMPPTGRLAPVETPRRGVSTIYRGVSTPYTTRRGVITNGGAFSNTDTDKNMDYTTVTNTTVSPYKNPNHKPQWKPGCLGAIINQFKSKCTKLIRTIYPDFSWQSRFHDRIIRDENALNHIREYIRNNPMNWENDRNNTKNLNM
ncbi:MAG: hypothetical protein Q8O95_03765 [bacterium]|nr:hypothetical protein [bacterium]